MIPEIGRRFGPYEILGRLGGGGMGHVFRAWDARLHREVAIKFLHDEFTMPGMRERFLLEARAASALNHPHICTIFDIGEQDGDPYLVMELLKGETLKDLIDKRVIALEELLCIAREVAEALTVAHAKGVIHRDIKPANIFLVTKPHSGFQTKVLDFGLAKIEGAGPGARTSRALDITTLGSTVGTLAYMSPEQARGEALDSRSDLFSLGVVLYEAATQHIPFPGATSALIFVKLLNESPEPVREWNEEIPKELEKIIQKLMAKERTARFQTARELWEALSKVDEKTTGRGWLRKAVTGGGSTRRSQDTPARERLLPKASTVNSEAVTDVSARPVEQSQFLRPVARVPRGDTMTRPGVEVVASEAAVTEVRPSGATAAEGVPEVVVNAPSVPEVPPELTSGAFAAVLSEEPGPPAERRVLFNPLWAAAGLALLVVVAIGMTLIVNRGHLRPTMLTERDSVVMTEIENQTNEKVLDGTVAQGLQIALAQSPYLMLRTSDSFRTMRVQVAPGGGDHAGALVARNTAQRLGCKAYFYGTITGTAAPFRLHVDLMNTGSNDVMSIVEETVASLQQLPEAIDKVSDELRSNVGEDSESIARTHNPLRQEATANVAALNAFTQGEQAYATGHTLDVVSFYQQATAMEPRFVLAQLRLTVLYRKQRAELAAAESARLALAGAAGTSERMQTFAQYQYAMNSTGDYNRAAAVIRHLVSISPHDSQALEALARVLRLQGRLTESLQIAQQAFGVDSVNIDAYTQADNALIGLDRYDAAYQLQEQEQRLGIARPGAMLTPAYLVGRNDVAGAAAAFFQNHTEGFHPDWNYGIYLDNIGRLAAGTQVWRRNAAAAMHVKGMESAGAFLLSQGALDHALLGDCVVGLAMAKESSGYRQGITALFNTGMASALCGDSVRARQVIDDLQLTYPQSFAVNGFYLADLQAAIALHDGDPAGALEVLKPARQYDLISLTPFLRGMAHVALKQGQIGIVDYQTVLAHRGVPFVVGSNVFPIAQIGVARAFADTGDLGNSADAYRRFLELWSKADPGQPLVNEARAHTKP
jgi:tRNA A-37 threonylcarbamoyl transferase component Bud32/tetratricopeptide (TPR) repeat protein